MNDKPDTPVGSFLKWIPVPPSEEVTVTLIAPLTEDGGETLYDFGTKEVQVENGSKLNADSAGEDYTLTNFYTDSALTIPFDYQNTPITEDKTLYVAGKPMMLSKSYSARLNNQEDNMTEVHFILAGEEPSGEPTATWDASQDGTGAVTAKMYEGGKTYFVAREGATHIWCPNATQLLSYTTKLTKVDGFKNLYGVKTLYGAFASASVLNDLGDIAELDLSQATSISKMFLNAHMPETLDLSGWDTSNITDFTFIFAETTSPCDLNVSGWVISEGATLQQTFVGTDNGTTGLKSINASNWTIEPEAINGKYLFAQEAILESIDITGWDFTKFANVNNMFYQDVKLKSIILGEGNYFNLKNATTKFDGFSGLFNFMGLCFALDTFNNTGDEKVDHTLCVRMPNVQGLNNTNAFLGLGTDSENNFYLDLDFTDEVYATAGDGEVELVMPGSAFIGATGAKQIKAFGTYNSKWEGAVLGTNHTNIVRNTSTSFYLGLVDQHTYKSIRHNSKYADIIIDRYIARENTTVVRNIPTLEWILVYSGITEEEASRVLAGELSTPEMQLRGYYNGGVWEANKVPLVYGYSKVATASQRGYLTVDPTYIVEGETDPTEIGGTLAEFNEAVQSGNLDKFPVGTEISDSYGEEDAPLIVVDYLNSANNTDYNGATGGLLMRKNTTTGNNIKWNTQDSGNYDTASVRTYLDDEYYNGCSEELKDITSEITIPYTTTSGTLAGTVTNKVFLPSVFEVSSSSAPDAYISGTGINFAYWKAAIAYSGNSPVNRIAYDTNGTASSWWTRTNMVTKSAYVIRTDGSAAKMNKSSQATIRPVFFVEKK